ncbi:hypothetical protein WT08_01815 [Burkholderia sp. MSMB1552]|nr:hypothetical protein WT08_01815 [Burkholderia sp. MSMB1552]
MAMNETLWGDHVALFVSDAWKCASEWIVRYGLAAAGEEGAGRLIRIARDESPTVRAEGLR